MKAGAFGAPQCSGAITSANCRSTPSIIRNPGGFYENRRSFGHWFYRHIGAFSFNRRNKYLFYEQT
jgi:hypothetical protein